MKIRHDDVILRLMASFYNIFPYYDVTHKMLMSAGAQGQEQQLFWLILIRSNPFSIIPSCIAIYALLEILDRGAYLPPPPGEIGWIRAQGK